MAQTWLERMSRANCSTSVRTRRCDTARGDGEGDAGESELVSGALSREVFRRRSFTDGGRRLTAVVPGLCRSLAPRTREREDVETIRLRGSACVVTCLSPPLLLVQVQVQIFIHDNAKKCTVKVRLENSYKSGGSWMIGKSALKNT